MSEFRRRLMMVRKAKPYDAEVEYLQSNGTQYIDIGFVGDKSIDYEIAATILSNTAEWQHILGDRYSNNSRMYSIMVNTSTKAAYFSCGRTNQLNVNNAFSLGVQSTYKKSGNTIYINGTAKGTITEQTFTTPNNIVLFGARNNGTLVYPFFGRIANCKFLRDGNTIRDFIPVRKNGVGYMYDKVTGELFGNAGTGSFTYGNDK